MPCWWVQTSIDLKGHFNQAINIICGARLNQHSIFVFLITIKNGTTRGLQLHHTFVIIKVFFAHFDVSEVAKTVDFEDRPKAV